MIEQNPAVQNGNFNLKNVEVELIPEPRAVERAELSIAELEAICGASCEIGAH